MLESIITFINNFFVDRLDAGASMLLVLGGTGSGKTVALTTAFNTLVNGVKVNSGTPRLAINVNSNSEDYRKTFELLTNAYREMQINGRLPVGTSENLMYTFRLELNGRGISKMRYLDYRGGIRSDQDPDPDELEVYQSALTNATMVAFVIPGDILRTFDSLSELSKNSVEYQIQVLKVNREMNQIKTQLFQLDDRNPKAPILFYVTKADYISNENRIPYLLEQLLSDYMLMHGDRQILGCYSTLGKAIKIDDHFRIHEGMAPEGFEIPILLAVGHHLRQIGAQSEKNDKKSMLEEINKLESERSVLKQRENRLESNLNARFIKLFAPEKKELAELREQISEKDKKLRELQEKCNGIRSAYSTEAQGVLTYLLEKCNNKIIYWNSPRKKQGVAEFFDDTAAMV